ncbi:MAG: FeoB-associated Cys-rich membrane protein [Flexilinea sp.]|nr:FeoB-associated Cys-rich membrane protein [Flexilinea sp.]
MIEWLRQNLASIVLLIVVALIVFFIVRSKIKEKKQGKCSCRCSGCSGCSPRRKGDSI